MYGDIQYRHINYGIDGFDDDLRVLDQEHLYNFINPKFGVKWMPADQHQVFGSFAIATREPKRSNFTDAAPDQQVVPENLMDTELGYQVQFNKALVQANAYFMYYEDQLVFTGAINDVGAAVMMNVPESYRSVLVLALDWRLTNDIELHVNGTMSQNKIINYTEYVDDWDSWGQQSNYLGTTDLALSPSLLLNSSVTWEPLNNLFLRWDSKYVGKQYIDNSSSDERAIDPFWVNNLSVYWSHEVPRLGSLSLYFQLLNALDESYESNAWVYSYIYEGQRSMLSGYYPQAGRHFLLGLTLEF